MTSKRLLPCGSDDDVAALRSAARACVEELGRNDLEFDVALVVSELVTNALLHGGGCTGVVVDGVDDGIRIEVHDRSPVPPLLGHASDGSLTGRGIRLVSDLAARWGAVPSDDGKVVWAEVTGAAAATADAAEVLASWSDDEDDDSGRVRVELGDVPTSLLLAAKSHVDNLVREFALLPDEEMEHVALAPRLRSLLAVVEGFTPRRAIKQQALAALAAGAAITHLELVLAPELADGAEEYLGALDEIDAYCRAGRLLTLETPPQHKLFRQWYISELVSQLRAHALGTPVAPMGFQDRLLDEIDRVAEAQRAAERSSRLYAVASALAKAATPEAVADAVLVEGVAALEAVAGGVLLAIDEDHFALPGAVGYSETVLQRLRAEPRDAELPAAVALRTGEPVWIESRAERDARFPELVGLERGTVSMCAVPLEVEDRRLGAVRFSFDSERLFDDDERQFVLALAAQASQALERAELQRRRFEAAQELQRSLLPPTLPTSDWLEAAAMYHPFGEGVEVGGDFYDMWPLGDGRFGIAIGDSAGTGLRAAALSALVRHTTRALVTVEATLEEAFVRLNQALILNKGDDASEQFCTAIAGRIGVTAEGATLQLAGAGHPPLLVRRADGSVEHHLAGGLPLGMFDEPRPEEILVELRPGDAAVLYTDGVIEARDVGREMFGLEQLATTLASCDVDAAGIVSAIEAAVLRHTSSVLSDDMAALVIRIPSP